MDVPATPKELTNDPFPLDFGTALLTSVFLELLALECEMDAAFFEPATAAALEPPVA